ncbi:LETM1-domain-containing protein [Meira miltonrushii]|uniref:Mitochondrial proton/calcium exchanger protein n=1 Tax=Meira miltonrushii TaxID=1280837 RepID=A0A316VFL6_9BASI|nr:LETM1-domain-containing protein [Meira miltonrushii]PWN36316.1 LETM1-domain-containing protein [Meira miltonrushii]
MSFAVSSSRRGLSLATSSLIASTRLYSTGRTTDLLVKAGRSKSTQFDVLRLFAPHFHLYSTLSGSSSVGLARKRKSTNANTKFALVRRYQHVQPHESSSSSTNFPPPTGKSQKSKDRSSSSPSKNNSNASQQSSETVNIATTPLKHAQQVTNVSAAELGSDANQLSASQSLLQEQTAKALAAKEAEEKWKSQPLLKRAWIKVKEEAAHYWHGTKLLAKEVSISSRLLRRLMMGYGLTRREHRQLKRTTADLLRLIPFLPFIIVPFGELLLPVAIKIFPNMLPSTFESKFAVEEKRRRLIKVRLEMAKFLQETIKEGGIAATAELQTSDEFKEFFRKVRSTGDHPSPEDTIRVAKLLEDDLTLDNLTRPQLVSMCRYLQINAFGTDNYLRYQIRTKLNKCKRDDMQISAEGVENLSLLELQHACQSRGIQTQYRSEKRLQEELKQWIDLHLHQRISGVLLILSRAFDYMPNSSSSSDENTQLRSLELTLSSLPDNLLSEAELNVSKDTATNKQRLEVLQQQEELIEDEAEQEQAEEEARKADKERKERNKEQVRLSREEKEAKAMLPKGEVDPATEDARMTNEQLTELGEALSILSAKSSVLKEREELAQLVQEMEESGVCGSDEKKNAASSTSSEEKAAAEEETQEQAARVGASSSVSTSSRGLAKRVRSMLQKIDAQLEDYDRDVGSRMNIIEASPSGKISVDDLEQALRLIKHRPDDEILERLVDKLDIDNDGLVPLTDVVELARKESGLGIVRDDNVENIRAEGHALRDERKVGLKREDIIEQ